MPLKDRDKSRPRRLIRLGIIRLGHKKQREVKKKDGTMYTVEYPVQDDHFVFTDAEDLLAAYGDDCRELDVLLPFPDVQRNFDAWYQVWAGGVLICKGDGEQVDYASPFSVVTKDNGKTSVRRAKGDTLVNSGQALCAFEWNGEKFASGDCVPCPGEAGGLYPHCAVCKRGGILKVMIADPEVFRFGYYQIATGSGRNYDSILGTLEIVSGGGQRPVWGVPFKLRLVQEATTYQEGGERKATEKWFLKLEPEPALMRKLYAMEAKMLVAEVDGVQKSARVIEGEVVDGSLDVPPPWAEEGGDAEEEGQEWDGDVFAATEDLGSEVVVKTQANFAEECKRLGITGAQVKKVLSGTTVTKWCEENQEDLAACLRYVREVLGR